MTYPLTKKVCQLDEQGIYAGQTDADLSPEEADNGVYLMPAGCVDIDPPEDKKVFPRPGLPQNNKFFSRGLSKFSIKLIHFKKIKVL